MAVKNDDKQNIRCTFCGKSQEEVHRIIAGPGVYICNECVELCHEIIEEDCEAVPADMTDIPKPQEIGLQRRHIGKTLFAPSVFAGKGVHFL